MSSEKKDKKSAGDSFNFTGADFRGAIININSIISNTKQTINAIPSTDMSTKVELEKLIEQLGKALRLVPPEKAEQAKAVATSAGLLVKTATEEKPNKTLIQSLWGMLKNTAKEVVDVMPTVLTLADQIGKLVLKLTM